MKSFEEFKFAQAFRIPVEKSDDLRFLIERPSAVAQTANGHDGTNKYFDHITITDISKTGVGLTAKENFTVGQRLAISLQYKRFHLDMDVVVVRSLSLAGHPDFTQYGVEYVDHDEEDLHQFLAAYVESFTHERMRTCLVKMALMDRYAITSEGLDMVSLIMALFKDITRLGTNTDFISTILEELAREMKAKRVALYLVDPKSNELKAQGTYNMGSSAQHFDYRVGVAGQIFTSGLALNIDVKKNHGRFHQGQALPDVPEEKKDAKTLAVIGHPIYNRFDKIVGVIEVLEHTEEGQFTQNDEKTLKIMAMIFSSVYHDYNPMVEDTKLRRFSVTHDRANALVGETRYIQDLRYSLAKLKDLDLPVLIEGEVGVGKTLFARILHSEGKRGPMNLVEVHAKELSSKMDVAMLEAHKGVILIKEIEHLDLETQASLLKIMQERFLPEQKFNLDVRVLATTCAPLERLTKQNKFLPKLYELLSATIVKIPPLRKRMQDLDQLAHYFLKVECKKQGLLNKTLSPKAMEELHAHRFSENIAELRIIVERAVRYFPKDHIIETLGNTVLHVWREHPEEVSSASNILLNHPHLKWEELSFKEQVILMEKDLLERHIHRFEGNKTQAAKALGITREGIRKILVKAERILARPKGQVLDLPVASKHTTEPLKDAA